MLPKQLSIFYCFKLAKDVGFDLYRCTVTYLNAGDRDACRHRTRPD